MWLEIEHPLKLSANPSCFRAHCQLIAKLRNVGFWLCLQVEVSVNQLDVERLFLNPLRPWQSNDVTGFYPIFLQNFGPVPSKLHRTAGEKNKSAEELQRSVKTAGRDRRDWGLLPRVVVECSLIFEDRSTAGLLGGRYTHQKMLSGNSQREQPRTLAESLPLRETLIWTLMPTKQRPSGLCSPLHRITRRWCIRMCAHNVARSRCLSATLDSKNTSVMEVSHKIGPN